MKGAHRLASAALGALAWWVGAAGYGQERTATQPAVTHSEEIAHSGPPSSSLRPHAKMVEVADLLEKANPDLPGPPRGRQAGQQAFIAEDMDKSSIT